MSNTLAAEHAGSFEREGGTLELLRLQGATLRSWTGDHLSRERLVRVWLPPGFAKNEMPEEGWPVAYLADGQNLFDDSEFGGSWRVDIAAASAIGAKQVPSCVLVGVDHGESLRSYDYMPYDPGSGDGDFRPEAAAWPGGGAEEYCDWFISDLMPLLEDRYNLASANPARMAFGGSSLGGMISLFMAMRHPRKFGALICLSPSFWTGKGRFLDDINAFSGDWPMRMYVAFGSKEFTYTRNSDRDDLDAKLVNYTESFIKTMRGKGLTEDRLLYELCTAEEAGHTEKAWRLIFPRAIAYVFGELDPVEVST